MPIDQERLTAALAGRYGIVRELGAGGMATVFLAEDLKHHRKVALKVLKPDLTAALGAERFVQEIATTAALQHPHILPLFDSGSADGFFFYVMPFIDGETLRTRLDRETQLPVADAVRLALEIADALDFAHQRGIIHRDIKPENILLLGGHALVADFGIALALRVAAGPRLTESGLSLGTPQYMSPEQATADKEITARSDVYSLGSVLYEMLAGRPPHTGVSAQQVIMKVIAERPPSISAERPSVPAHLAAVVARALEKVPADRFSSAREFATALADDTFTVATRDASSSAAPAGRDGAVRRSTLRQPVVLGLGVLLLASVAANLVQVRRPTASSLNPQTVRFALPSPDSVLPTSGGGSWSVAISPDGTQLVYTTLETTGSSATILRLRRSDRLEAEVIRGTHFGTQPIFSPDGQWLAFVAEGKLKKMRLDGSAPVTIAEDAGGNDGADWTTTNELILGATGAIYGLARVPAAGGQLTPLTRPDSARGERNHFWPIALPDGKQVAFVIWSGGLATAELAIASLDDGRVTRLGLKGVRPLGVLDGALVYHRADGVLMAAPLDAAKRKITGSPVPVHDPVPLPLTSAGESNLFLSRGGSLVSMLRANTAQISWVNRDGNRQPIGPDRRDFRQVRLSPAQDRLAALVGGSGGYDIWLQDLADGALTRLTTSASITAVAWKPDGSGVVYSDNAGDIWSQAVDRAASPTPLVRSLNMVAAIDLSPDGRSLLAEIWEDRWVIVRIALDSATAVHPFSRLTGWSSTPRVSPDGRWATFINNGSGANEVYLHSFPDALTKLQVSTAGGMNPVWSADGTRLYYNAGGAIVAARLQLGPNPRVVSRDTIVSGTASVPVNFDVAANGERIVAAYNLAASSRLEVAVNWLTEFRRKMAAGAH